VLNRLSKREKEVLQLLCAGCTDTEVAAELGISPANVRHHAKAIQIGLQERSIATLCRGLAAEHQSASPGRR
jgi:DNA-binding NarL/FixJ family response regulator